MRLRGRSESNLSKRRYRRVKQLPCSPDPLQALEHVDLYRDPFPVPWPWVPVAATLEFLSPQLSRGAQSSDDIHV